MATLEATNLRYILFLIDSKHKQHDGKVFCRLQDAKEYAQDCINEQYSDKAVIGMFLMDPNDREMLITMVDTIGFGKDKKDINQLELFSNFTKS
jgi:hypothetical protein